MSAEPSPQSDLILYQTEDGRTRIQCRFENETVWLTQQHMAELFQTTQQNVSLHVRNIYEEGELAEGATHKECLSVRQEGTRSVQRRVEFYNLDVIISVGRIPRPVDRRRSAAIPDDAQRSQWIWRQGE